MKGSTAWLRRSPRLFFRDRTMEEAGNARAYGALHAESTLQKPVAVAQMTSTSNKDQNLEIVSRLAEQAVSAGCSMMFLPECFAFIGESPAETVGQAERIEGSLLRKYSELAKNSKLWLNLGGFHEASTTQGKVFNTQIMLNDRGEIVSLYRKVHLFDVDVPNGPVLMESRTTVAGKELVSCETPVGKMGLTTCYDVRFPLMYQILRFKHDVQAITVPSAFTTVTGEAHWEVLLRTRAIENQCYIIASAQAGRHNAKRESFGHSMVVDPWGKVIARLEDPLATGIAVCELDMKHLLSVRERMPLNAHRKAALYHYWESQ